MGSYWGGVPKEHAYMLVSPPPVRRKYEVGLSRPASTHSSHNGIKKIVADPEKSACDRRYRAEGDGFHLNGNTQRQENIQRRVFGRGYTERASAAEINSTAEATTQVALATTTGRADTHLAEAAVEWVLK